MRVMGPGGGIFDIDFDIASEGVRAQLERAELVPVDDEGLVTTVEQSDLGDEDEDGEYPADGTVADVLAWVDGDYDRARIAKAAELGRDDPRKGVLDAVDDILDED